MKSLNVYVASSFDEAQRCENVLAILQKWGHKVPDVWWNIRTKDDYKEQSDEAFYSSPLVKAICARHWITIREADLVILVSNYESPRSFTGANVEIGYAMALGKPVLSIGKLKRSAMYRDVIQCKTYQELAAVVDCIAQNMR